MITLPKSVLEQAIDDLADVTDCVDNTGERYQSQWYADQITALRAALNAPQAEPVAWMYEGEPSFDGDNWHKQYEVTTSKQLAEFMSGTIKKPVPLCAVPVIPAEQAKPVASFCPHCNPCRNGERLAKTERKRAILQIKVDELQTEINVLRANPAPAIPAGWQQIETAPKDGDRVLVWIEEPSLDRDQRKIQFARLWFYEDGQLGGGAEGFNGTWNITHWMPLPAAPSCIENSEKSTRSGDVSKEST